MPESTLENKCMQLAIADKGLIQCLKLTQYLCDVCLGLVAERIHFGLQKRGEANFTKWINELPLNYSVWLPGQPEPNLLATEECGMSW